MNAAARVGCTGSGQCAQLDGVDLVQEAACGTGALLKRRCSNAKDEAYMHRKRRTYDQGKIPTTAALRISLAATSQWLSTTAQPDLAIMMYIKLKLQAQRRDLKAHLQLHDVRVHGAGLVVQQLPRDDLLVEARPLAQELDGHQSPRAQVLGQLHRPARPPADGTESSAFFVKTARN